VLGFRATKGFKEYSKRARAILDANWTGNYTKPSGSLYPHQWNWDSGFIAIGYAHYNQRRAQREVLSLFNHQWPNGMVPQIVFNPKVLGNYFPEPDFWQVPEGRLTSGITMPPIHATSCLHIYRKAKDREEAEGFLKVMFPKLVASHKYLYGFRDPEQSGLVYIRHPWESGLDNSPAWDLPLGRIKILKSDLPSYSRKDLDHGVPEWQRPSDVDYDRYVYMVDLFRRLKYKERDIYHECPFIVQDVLFNSILCRADRDLVEIGDILGEDITQVRQWFDTTAKAIINQLWCPDCRRFESFDLRSKDHIHTATAASFMPLFAGAVSSEKAEELYEAINSVSFCALHQGNCFTIPNYDMTKEDFDSGNYWRGPVWVNVNWMISQGLKFYGYQKKADAMKADMIQLPIRFGFYEYFDSIKGKGYGSNNFSWTSALFLDLIDEYYDKDEHTPGWFGGKPSRTLKKKIVLNESSIPAGSTSDNIAAQLMESIWDMKEKYYDLRRGIVDYDALRHSPEYRDYIRTVGMLKKFDLEKLSSSSQKKAFWINLYNTIVIHGIVELGIISSVKEFGNFFSKIEYQIGDYTFSADEIEHGILRSNARPPFKLFPVFGRKDARREFSLKKRDRKIHFSLVCGSRSCAPIRFYSAENIEEQLDSATENFINSSEVLILPEENKIFLSQIFSWYWKDFGGRKALFDFILKYFKDSAKSDFLRQNMDSIDVEYLFYDWNLNH
jgi:hypothetical protein